MSHHSYSYRFCKPESHHHQQKQWSFCMDNAYAVWITDHLQSSWNHKGGYDVIGSDKDDCITGSACDDNLYGAGGNDTIYGGKGNDVIDGGKGAENPGASRAGGGPARCAGRIPAGPPAGTDDDDYPF